MDFGDTLHELLKLAGVKQAHLAEFLGYDVSYINKWISGQKRPSVRNNQELFNKIGDFLVRYAGEDFVRDVVSKFELATPANAQHASNQISELLSRAYSPSYPRREESQFNNSHFGSMTDTYTVNVDQLTEAIGRAIDNSGNKDVEFISFPLLSYCGGNDARKAWRAYERLLPCGKRLHVRFGVDFNSAEHLSDICHDVFIFLYGLSEKISFDIYHTDAFSTLNQGIYICRDAVLTISYYDVLMRNDSVVWTHDQRIVSMYYSSADRHIGLCRQLIMRASFDELYQRKYFRKFFFGGGAESFHTVMPLLPLSGADICLKEVREPLGERLWDMWRFLCGNSPSRRVILYEHTLMNFAYDGYAYMLGTRIELKPQERCAYLECLIRAVNSAGLELVLLADSNPVLSAGELCCSIYMSQKDMFSFGHSISKDEVIYSGDETLIKGYRLFLDKLISGNPSRLAGATLTDFLRRCAQQALG